MLTSKIMGGAGDLTDGKETSYKDNLYLAVNELGKKKLKCQLINLVPVLPWIWI